jgi:hypothetical protein
LTKDEARNGLTPWLAHLITFAIDSGSSGVTAMAGLARLDHVSWVRIPRIMIRSSGIQEEFVFLPNTNNSEMIQGSRVLLGSLHTREGAK